MARQATHYTDDGVLYVELRAINPGEVARSEEVGENVVLDYDRENNLVGIEVLGIDAIRTSDKGGAE